MRSRDPHRRSGRAERSPCCRRAQFGALLGRQGVHQPLRRGRAAGQRVDQLPQILGLVGEELAVLPHEIGELLGRVLAAGIGIEHVVEGLHHLAHPAHVGLTGVAHGVAQTRELRVEHLLTQQLLDLLVLLPSLGRAPLVVAELAHRAGGVGRQRVEFGLGHARGVGGVGEQRGALRLQRLLEQLLGLLQRAVEAPGAAQLARPLAGALAQRVQAVLAVGSRPQQSVQGIARGRPGQHVLTHLVQGAADVVGRLQRVGPAVPYAVVVTRHVAPPNQSGRRLFERSCVWCSAGGYPR
jgi:hypothetical protein